MIANEIHKKPMLSFGLGVVAKTISLGDTVTIFQNSVYNDNGVVLNFGNASKSIYGFSFQPLSVGQHDLQCLLQIKTAGVVLKSNIIKLTVI